MAHDDFDPTQAFQVVLGQLRPELEPDEEASA